MVTAVFFIRVGAILGGMAVALGAFGAHLLKQRLAPDLFEIFEVGVRYHFYHTFAILVTAAVGALWPGKWATAACAAWLLGTVVFSGSLYLLALTGARWLGAITPLGGVALIVGWVFLFLAAGAVVK